MTDADVELVATGYDAVYEGVARSPAFDRIWQGLASGDDYPREFGHISFLTLSEISEVARSLHLERGGSLVDLACGMGGPGLWVARETGAGLSGIDISKVALREAAQRAERLGLSERAVFELGSFSETGREAASFDAAMTIDALQYAPDKVAASAEIARILRPGGRFVFTAFEVDPTRVAGLPVWGTDPVPDYRRPLEDVGFVVETYEETPGWKDRLKASYSAVLREAETLAGEMGELAVAALQSEMTITLEIDPYRRRVFCVAVAGPQGS